jgi:small-conductance mechanosensitive channel
MERAKQSLTSLGSLIVLGLLLIGSGKAIAQNPGPNAVPKSSGPAVDKKPVLASRPEEPASTVAAPTGPITLEKPLEDFKVRDALSHLLIKYPGVRSVEIEVDHGVVTLEGQVENEELRDSVTQFTRKVEGVRLVLNRMQTDAQVLSAWQLGEQAFDRFWQLISREWLLFLIALGYVVLSLALARLCATYSESLLSPFIKNVMLRSVAGSLLSTILIVTGLMMGLSVLNLTHLVLSIVGLAGVVGLTVGFAFRDITENFIASILLGLRRPFRVGDYIQVAGQAGVVKTLNTRATVLVTLEGNHIRIPNNTIYKEIMINSTASATTRQTFDVVIPYEASTATAIDVITKAIRQQEGVLSEPPPQTLVEALETNGVRLRSYYWLPVQGVDGMKLLSDLRLKAKVALQQAGIAPPPMGVLVSVVGRVPVEVYEADGRFKTEAVLRSRAIVSHEEAEVNLQRDKQAADTLTAVQANGEKTVVEHVLNDAEIHVSEEGTNLLAKHDGHNGAAPVKHDAAASNEPQEAATS